MKQHAAFESIMWKVLEKERLADLSQFHRPGFFDELPLYSRDAQIDFLRGLAPKEAETFLIGFGLKYLRSVICYDRPQMPFLACLTFRDDPEDRLLVPRIFVRHGDWTGPLRDFLALEAPSSPLARRIVQGVRASGAFAPIEVFEDRESDPEWPRVMIDYWKRLHPEMVPLRRFARRAGTVETLVSAAPR